MYTSRAIVPSITFDEADLGPAMLALNPGERAWVYHKVEFGLNNMEAARAAGYSASSDDALKSAGYAIAHRLRVQDALLEMSRKLMRSEGPKSIKTLVDIRDDKAVKPEVRAKAAVELLNRAGMNAVSEAHLLVTHELNENQMDARILQMCAELGLDAEAAKKLLISPSNFVEAEFTEVEAEISPEEQARRSHENAQRRAVRAMSPEQLKAHKAQQRAEKSERAKAKRAAAEEEHFLASGREGLEDVL